MTRSSFLSLVLLLLVPPGALASKTGTLARDTELRERPNPIAAVVTTAPTGSALEVLGRRGYWVEVRLEAGGHQGWVRTIRVRYDAAAPASESAGGSGGGGGFFSSLARSATALIGGAATDPRPATATIGIRGLSAGDLETAQPDAGALERLARDRASPVDARVFAKAGALAVHDVADDP